MNLKKGLWRRDVALLRMGVSEDPLWTASPPGDLDRQRCQVGGLNQNYTSSAGTLYHIQIEDLGPVVDRVTEPRSGGSTSSSTPTTASPTPGSSTAATTTSRTSAPTSTTRPSRGGSRSWRRRAREVIEEKERKQVARIKGLIREYYLTKTDKAKRAFEEANGLFPFLFSRAWSELKREKAAADRGPRRPPRPRRSRCPEDVLYPLDAALRERVIDIERLIHAIGEDLGRLKAAGKADDILIQTCRKLTRRAQEALAGPRRPPSSPPAAST